MIIPDPAWVSAGAETVLAVETGVGMFSNKKQKGKDEAPAAAAVRPVSSDAVVMFAGFVILAMAMMASAIIIHHGLMG
jgi:hypothetical protein